MAFANTNTGTTFAPARTNIFLVALNAIAQWNDTRITRKSLSKLSARELEDIGLSFGDIDSIAARSVR